jgi:hypothetical protein
VSDTPSRRDLLKLGAAGVASLAFPNLPEAQTMLTTDEIEKQLGHPLPEAAKSLMKGALEANQRNAKDRLAKTLSEGSEPCFVFRPTKVKK